MDEEKAESAAVNATKPCGHEPNPPDDADVSGRKYEGCYQCFIAGLEALERKQRAPDPSLDYILVSIKLRTARRAYLQSCAEVDAFLAHRSCTLAAGCLEAASQRQWEMALEDTIIVMLCDVATRLRKTPPQSHT